MVTRAVTCLVAALVAAVVSAMTAAVVAAAEAAVPAALEPSGEIGLPPRRTATRVRCHGRATAAAAAMTAMMAAAAMAAVAAVAAATVAAPEAASKPHLHTQESKNVRPGRGRGQRQGGRGNGFERGNSPYRGYGPRLPPPALRDDAPAGYAKDEPRSPHERV